MQRRKPRLSVAHDCSRPHSLQTQEQKSNPDVLFCTLSSHPGAWWVLMEGGGTRDPSCGSWLFSRGAVCEGRPFLAEEDGVTGSRVMVGTEPPGDVLRCTYPQEGPRGASSRLPSGLGRLAGGEGGWSPWAGGLPNTTSSVCPGAIHIQHAMTRVRKH